MLNRKGIPLEFCKATRITFMAISGNVALNADSPPHRTIFFQDLIRSSMGFEWTFPEENGHRHLDYALELHLTGEVHIASTNGRKCNKETFWRYLNQREVQ